MCKDSLTTPGGSRLVYPSFFIQALTKINSTSLEDACVVDSVTSMGCNCTDHLLEELLENYSVNNSLNQSCVGLPTKSEFLSSCHIYNFVPYGHEYLTILLSITKPTQPLSCRHFYGLNYCLWYYCLHLWSDCF